MLCMNHMHSKVMDEQEGGEDTCLRLVAEYDKGHFFKQIYLRIIKFALFAYAMDPLSIYKGTHRKRDALRYQIYLTPQLRIERNYIDRWRDRWRSLSRAIVVYICIKFSLIVLIQAYMSLYTRRRMQEYTTISLIANGESHDQSKPWASTSIQEQETADLINNEQGSLALFNHLLGNPLAGLPGLTVFIYSVIVASIAGCLLYFPILYQMEAMDWVNFRLWLEPVREFKRIDMIVLETMKNYGKPFRRFCYCSFGKHSSCGPHYALITSRAIQTKVIGLFRLRYWCFRPVIYTINWYKTFNRIVIFLSIPMVILLTTYFSLIAQLLFNITKNYQKYSPFQLMTIAETAAGLSMAVATIMLLIVIFLCNCISHLLMLRDTEQHLLTCLDVLKRMGAGYIEEVDHMAVISVMLRPLICTSLSLEELRVNAKSLTEMVSVNLCISAVICVSILLAENLDGEDLYLFRVTIMIGLWFWANITLVGCAYVYNGALKIEKITWSLMAEIRLRETKEDWLLFESQVAEFWRRLIFSRSFSESRLSVRPFGATLTYDRALQLNFLAITIAGILRTIYE